MIDVEPPHVDEFEPVPLGQPGLDDLGRPRGCGPPSRRVKIADCPGFHHSTPKRVEERHVERQQQRGYHEPHRHQEYRLHERDEPAQPGFNLSS